MTQPKEPTTPAETAEDQVDTQIAECLSLTAPKSFFLFAGAGSGKTRSLVTALQFAQEKLGRDLRIRGQKIGVITFTNAACEEIKRRIEFDPLIDVRTIHSFSWSLIKGLNRDIRLWLETSIHANISDLMEKEAKGRRTSKASIARRDKIQSYKERLNTLHEVKTFTYSPSGDNVGLGALNHAEVLKLTSHFLTERATMRQILVGRYPFLLIDESQDTNNNLLESILATQRTHHENFSIGLIGDMMQRIYFDGKDNIDAEIPTNWATPRKSINYRCPKRVVTLINKVRSTTDGLAQRPRFDAAEGAIRLFLLPSQAGDKPSRETHIAKIMAEVTQDEHWTHPPSVKTLTLEHRMAAARMGFTDAFEALYQVDRWRTSLLQGELPALRFFSDQIIPAVSAKNKEDRFALAQICRRYSSLLSSDQIEQSLNSREHLLKVDNIIAGLADLINSNTRLIDVACYVFQNKLFNVPESLTPSVAIALSQRQSSNSFSDESGGDADPELNAIEKFLQAPLARISHHAGC